MTTFRRAFHHLLLAGALASALTLGVLPASEFQLARAHASATAVAEFNQPLLAAPDPLSDVLLELTAGSELELTGAASGRYVQATIDGVVGWVAVDLIYAGQITTAVANQTTLLTAAPADDAALIRVVPAGDTVILTGAAVDAWLAGSYDGNGGWLPAANLDR